MESNLRVVCRLIVFMTIKINSVIDYRKENIKYISKRIPSKSRGCMSVRVLSFAINKIE